MHVEECEDTVEDIIYPLFDLIQDSIMINRYIKHRDSNVLYHSPKDTHVVENSGPDIRKDNATRLICCNKKKQPRHHVRFHQGTLRNKECVTINQMDHIKISE